MSKIEELIKKLCPNGVEYRKLTDVANVLYGYPCDATMFNEANNGVPLIRIRNVLAGMTETYTTENIPQEYVIKKGDLLVGMDGNFHVGNWKMDEAFLCQRVCKIYAKNNENNILNGFLSHLLGPIMKKIENGKQSGTVKHLLAKDINSISIPIPPLEVQREIVRILDNFSSLTSELTAKLSAELTARKKQYEYYLRTLVSIDTHDEIVTLNEVIKKATSGSTPKKGNSDYYNNATVPWIRTQDVCFNEITSVDSYISEVAVKETSAKPIPVNCVIVAISGATAGKCAINKIEAATNQHCLNLQIDEKIALYKYVFYCVYGGYERLIGMKQGARGDLNSSLIKSLEIYLPSLEEQQRIVDVLDRFDSLCNDLSSGLPAEIEARQKQYEYYRQKLLNFK